MRLIKSTEQKSEDESASSSLRSADSYGIFGSGCSDYSDCECAEERRQKHKHLPSALTLARRLKDPEKMIHLPSALTLARRLKDPEKMMSFASLCGGSLQSYRGAMGECAPLLTAAKPPPAYHTMADATSSDSLGPAELSAREILATYKRTFEKSVKPEKKKQSSLVTIFSVWNTIMGSSLLTMAWGVERAGLVVALVLVAAMAAVCLYTAHLLLRVNYHHGSESCEVPALCRALLGRWAEALAHAFSLLVLLGAAVVYWVLITNFLYFTVNYLVDLQSTTTYNATLLCPREQLVPLAAPDLPSPYWGLHSTVPLYAALLVFPLLNFNNVSFFTKFNSLGTLSVLYLLVFVAAKGASWGVHLRGWGEARARDAAVLSGMLALSFYIHNIIITIMSNNARQEKNGRDLSIAFLLVTATYTLVGVVFYVCFPLAKSCIEDNILNNFEMHDVMTAIARALLLFQVITVFPLVAFMLRSEALLLLDFKPSTWPTLAANLAIVAVCILVACLCPNVGTIIRYTGALSGLVHVFVLPAALRARSLQLRGRLTAARAALLAAIAAAGAANLLLQFFINE